MTSRCIMRASKIVDTSMLRYPVLVSPKYDGIRAWVNGYGELRSRNDKPIRNKHIQKMFGFPFLSELDGELICGDACAKDCMSYTDSIVMSRDKPADDCVYWIFDLQNELAGYAQRSIMLKALVKQANISNLKVVPQKLVKTEAELLAFEDYVLELGYEGVMVRSTNGFYKLGQSTLKEGWLLKLKRFEDSEALIIGVKELQHNQNERGADGKRTKHKAGMVAGDTLGAMICMDLRTRAEFDLGGGTSMTAAMRDELWALHLRGKLVNRIANYQFFPRGMKNDVPRFPTFKGLRKDLR